MAFELLPLKPEQHTISFVPRVSLELPFFNLTGRRKKTPEVIRYEGRDEAGRPIKWEVFQNTSKEVGAPAVEAHEVWYLLVKPSIDASRKADGAIPEIIPLGGVRELIKALTQISFAGCVADLWVPTGEEDGEGKKKFLQIKGRFSRMSVYAIGEYHLTEEELAQNKFQFDLGDTIYIRLDPLESKLQQMEDRRILDNQYLFSLTPAARRWYELMAGKIYGTVKNNANFCEINYSWYTKHHHTLKRSPEHKRVRFQMDRVIRDHLESGYISKVEYRAAKEPDREIDYVIRYYPGPGAKQSNERIQQFIRERRNKKRPRPSLHAPVTHEARGVTHPVFALAVITTIQRDLTIDLIQRFRMNPLRATKLVLKSPDVVRRQIEAWPFRNTAPRNVAGWMIQAIENNYELPASYLSHKEAQSAKEAHAQTGNRVRECDLCDYAGFRHVRSPKYPRGAMRQCSHILEIETQYQLFRSSGQESETPPNAQNSLLRPAEGLDDKRATDEFTSP